MQKAFFAASLKSQKTFAAARATETDTRESRISVAGEDFRTWEDCLRCSDCDALDPSNLPKDILCIGLAREVDVACEGSAVRCVNIQVVGKLCSIRLAVDGEDLVSRNCSRVAAYDLVLDNDSRSFHTDAIFTVEEERDGRSNVSAQGLVLTLYVRAGGSNVVAGLLERALGVDSFERAMRTVEVVFDACARICFAGLALQASVCIQPDKIVDHNNTALVSEVVRPGVTKMSE